MRGLCQYEILSIYCWAGAGGHKAPEPRISEGSAQRDLSLSGVADGDGVRGSSGNAGQAYEDALRQLYIADHGIPRGSPVAPTDGIDDRLMKGLEVHFRSLDADGTSHAVIEAAVAFEDASFQPQEFAIVSHGG